jgi:hypothetical protein
MDSASSLFEVIIKLGIPVGVLSYLMVSWAFKKGVLQEKGEMKALSAEIKALKQARKEEKKNGGKKPKINPIQAKWLKFGGGWYGIVAMYTYGLVEFNELREFVANLGGFVEMISNFHVRMIIEIFVEGLKNFITAITWPYYWMKEFGSSQMWYWMGIAYGGYWLGMKAAQHFIVDAETQS